MCNDRNYNDNNNKHDIISISMIIIIISSSSMKIILTGTSTREKRFFCFVGRTCDGIEKVSKDPVGEVVEGEGGEFPLNKLLITYRKTGPKCIKAGGAAHETPNHLRDFCS